MRRFRNLSWLLAAALVLALLVWRSGTGARQLQYYAPDDYVERAERFIDAGYLVADCADDPMRLVPRLDEAPAHERSWYAESYLAADVARFNADPDGFGWAFAIDDDCRLRGVNPVVHAVDLPFVDRPRWLGHVLYDGQGSDAVLRSARRSITLMRADTPVSARDQATTRVGAGEEVVKEGVVLLHFAGGPGQPAARLFHVGDEVVVANRVRAQRPEAVRLMGHQLPVGMTSRLETGDWLHLEADAPARAEETFVYVGGEALEAASVVRLQNERYERKSEDAGLGFALDPVRESAVPYLDQVARGLDAVLAVLPEEKAAALARGFDVQLTLRRDVQLRLDRVFRGACSRLRRDRDLDPFAAGLTVLDGMTGKVLALATYPHEDDLAGDALDGAARRRLVRNQNFVRHPVGSAGKPFFFAAIAHAYPELLELAIAGHEEERHHRDLFQCEIPTGYQLLVGHGERVDFRTALEISCNKYTVELATLALAADLSADASIPVDVDVEWPRPGAEPGLWLAGRPLRGAPDLGGYVFRDAGEPEEDETTAAVRCSSLDRFDQVRYRAALEHLTGATTYRGRLPQGLPATATRRQLESGYTTNRYDLSPWAPLLAYLLADAGEDKAWRIRAALQEVAPERVNLAFNQVTELRGDYVSLLLGGGSSIWTDVQLAEALARLVTGRQVEARLASRVLGRDAPEETEKAQDVPEPLELRPEARRAVLDGLERVVDGGRGTARELRPELEAVRRAFPEDRIVLYSKTGSPVLERAVPGAVATALEGLVARRRLAFEDGRVVVHVGGRTAPYRRGGEHGRGDYLDALGRALVDVGSVRGGRVQRVVRNLVDDLVADLRRGRSGFAEIDGPLQVERGALRLNREDRLFRRRMVREMGSVYVFALVRLPSGASMDGAALPPEARVVVAALHLDVGPDSKVAVEVARVVVPELAALLR